MAREGKTEKHLCDALKKVSSSYSLSKEQKSDLDKAMESFQGYDFFAVRSSSPEEDTSSSSFAGIYETYLGVGKTKLEDAIRDCFISCLDYRIVVYKLQSHVDITNPKIAVVIQSQIRSEKAGVGFTLNPLNNDYDEAYINFGLGETVVSGTASTDNFIIDKTNATIKSKELGAKELSLFLEKSGEIIEKKSSDSSSYSLNDREVMEIYDQLNLVEKYYQIPMDIEWAIKGETLYILQARPITTYFYIPESIRTKPSERRSLYWDLTLSVQGFDKPMSPMGSELLNIILPSVMKKVTGQNLMHDINNYVAAFIDGRIIANLEILNLFLERKI